MGPDWERKKLTVRLGLRVKYLVPRSFYLFLEEPVVFFLTHWEIPKLILLVAFGYAISLAILGWLLSVIWAPLTPMAYMLILWHD